MVRVCHKTCRGKKQLTVLRVAAHKGGTHREPKPLLGGPPQRCLLESTSWEQKDSEARHCSEVELLHINNSSLETLRVCERAVYTVTSGRRVEIHWPGDMGYPRLTGTWAESGECEKGSPHPTPPRLLIHRPQARTDQERSGKGGCK